MCSSWGNTVTSNLAGVSLFVLSGWCQALSVCCSHSSNQALRFWTTNMPNRFMWTMFTAVCKESVELWDPVRLSPPDELYSSVLVIDLHSVPPTFFFPTHFCSYLEQFHHNVSLTVYSLMDGSTWKQLLNEPDWDLILPTYWVFICGSWVAT